MDAVDFVRGALDKEVVARNSKGEALDVAVRDVRLRINEVQQREAAVRLVKETQV